MDRWKVKDRVGRAQCKPSLPPWYRENMSIRRLGCHAKHTCDTARRQDLSSGETNPDRPTTFGASHRLLETDTVESNGQKEASTMGITTIGLSSGALFNLAGTMQR